MDLSIDAVESDHWYLMPAAVLGGAIAGPFVALLNGVIFDWNYKWQKNAYEGPEFLRIFRPFKSLRDFDAGRSGR